MRPPLIAPKHITEYGPCEYHTYISSHYALPAKRGRTAVKASPAPGLTVGRTKKGALSIRRTKVRPFAYVTGAELDALAAAAACTKTELWNAFRARDFIIAKDRLEAEHTYAKLKELPF